MANDTVLLWKVSHTVNQTWNLSQHFFSTSLDFGQALTFLILERILCTYLWLLVNDHTYLCVKFLVSIFAILFTMQPGSLHFTYHISIRSMATALEALLKVQPGVRWWGFHRNDAGRCNSQICHICRRLNGDFTLPTKILLLLYCLDSANMQSAEQWPGVKSENLEFWNKRSQNKNISTD